ncbi:hypothetical protein SDJN03_24877, partial [Cucurbita argyrosperma subsp. sororia]
MSCHIFSFPRLYTWNVAPTRPLQNESPIKRKQVCSNWHTRRDLGHCLRLSGIILLFKGTTRANERVRSAIDRVNWQVVRRKSSKSRVYTTEPNLTIYYEPGKGMISTTRVFASIKFSKRFHRNKDQDQKKKKFGS